jgi:hypothetical protein
VGWLKETKMKRRKALSSFLILGLIALSVFGLIGASLGIKAIPITFDGEKILIDSTESADTSPVYNLAKADSVVFWCNVYDGCDSDDSVVAIVYYVSPITGAITALGEIDTFAADGEIRKVINTVAGYWGLCVVVNRIGTGDPGDSVEIQAIPYERFLRR